MIISTEKQQKLIGVSVLLGNATLFRWKEEEYCTYLFKRARTAAINVFFDSSAVWLVFKGGAYLRTAFVRVNCFWVFVRLWQNLYYVWGLYCIWGQFLLHLQAFITFVANNYISGFSSSFLELFCCSCFLRLFSSLKLG